MPVFGPRRVVQSGMMHFAAPKPCCGFIVTRKRQRQAVAQKKGRRTATGLKAKKDGVKRYRTQQLYRDMKHCYSCRSSQALAHLDRGANPWQAELPEACARPPAQVLASLPLLPVTITVVCLDENKARSFYEKAGGFQLGPLLLTKTSC